MYPHSGWLYSDWMLDTNHARCLVVDEFEPAVVAVPLEIATEFERDTLVVFEVVAVLQHVADAELKRPAVLIPVDGVKVVAHDPVQLVTVVTIAPVARR